VVQTVYIPSEQGGAREGGDGDGTHVDPVGRRQSLHGHREKDEPIEDERDERQIEHRTEQVHAERYKKLRTGRGDRSA
jgi:hypothetical protein